jgi:purine-nucleoside phosphorylase
MQAIEKRFIVHKEISFTDIPNFPTSTVASHSGKIILASIDEQHVLIMSGRFHYYEGYEMSEVTFYIHVLNRLGIQNIIFTNASGGLNPHFNLGDIVMISDHINLFPANPLRGQNDDSLGPRYPDMLHTYNESFRKSASIIANELKINMKEGVYLGWQGPSLETPAEYRMARILGADLIGMSTVPEVIVAKYYNMKIAAFSIVSNVCFPISAIEETTVDQILEEVCRSSKGLGEVIERLIDKMVIIH